MTDYCNEHERELIRTLQSSHALISSHELGAILHMDPRSVRSMIAHLRQEHRLPICSTASGGYWYPSSRDDAQRCLRELYSRRREIDADIECILDGLDAEFGERRLFDERMAV